MSQIKIIILKTFSNCHIFNHINMHFLLLSHRIQMCSIYTVIFHWLTFRKMSNKIICTNCLFHMACTSYSDICNIQQKNIIVAHLKSWKQQIFGIPAWKINHQVNNQKLFTTFLFIDYRTNGFSSKCVFNIQYWFLVMFQKMYLSKASKQKL